MHHSGHSQQGFQQADLAGVLAGLAGQYQQQQQREVDTAQGQAHSAYQAASQLHQETKLMGAKLAKLRASKDELQREVASLREQKTRLLADVANLQDVEQDIISSVSALHRHKKALHSETPYLEQRAHASAALGIVQEYLLACTNELKASVPGALPRQLEDAIGELAGTPKLNASLGPPARPPPSTTLPRPQAWQQSGGDAAPPAPQLPFMAPASQQQQQKQQQRLEAASHSHVKTRSAAELAAMAMSSAVAWEALPAQSMGYMSLQQAGSMQPTSATTTGLQQTLPDNMDMASLTSLLQQHNLGGMDALQQLQQQSPFQQLEQQQQRQQAALNSWKAGQQDVQQQRALSQRLAASADMTDAQLAKLAALGPADLDSTLIKLQTV